MNAEAYARQLKQLLPRGAAWKLDSDGWLHKLMLGIGDELARIEARAVKLLDEWDPATTLELIEEWERVLGLPDTCVDEVPDSITERRTAIAQKLAARGGQTPQFYIDLAASLGYAGVTIEEFSGKVLRAGFRCGSRAYGPAWAYAWRLTLPVSEPSGLKRFRAGSRAGERLSGFKALDIQCLVRRSAPAHTVVLFAYT